MAKWYETFFLGLALAEIKRLLEKAGLKPTAVYGSTSKKAYKLGDPQLYLVAEKQ
jgi:hypothetical protein